MRVILACVTFIAALTQCHNFVLTQEEIILSVRETFIQNPAPVTYLQNTVEKTGKADSSFCVDENGHKVHGLVEYKKDCRKFVSCGYNAETIMNCSAGTLFNNVTKNCGWPIEANCIEFRGRNKSKLVIPTNEIIW